MAVSWVLLELLICFLYIQSLAGSDTSCDGFQCKDNTCIPSSWQCDGRPDCPDQWDEDSCESDACANSTCSHLCRLSPKGPECFCNNGYALSTKDNRTCSDIDECSEDGFCSQHCTNFLGGYKCSCSAGYVLVNRTCKATGPEPILIVSTLDEIDELFLHSKKTLYLRDSIYKVAAIDVNPVESKIYWVEISNKSSVYSANIAGEEHQVVMKNGLMIPEGIAVDYIARNLYLTDSGLKQILACKIDGSMCHVLHSSNLEKPRAITLDTFEGLLYWSDWGDKAPGIYRSDLDGARRTALVSKNIKWPNGIAIDHTTNRLYWTDAQLKTIEYYSLKDGTRKVLVKDETMHPYAIAVFEDNVYWSDWNSPTVDTCNKFKGERMNFETRDDGKRITGVYVDHSLLTRTISNPCWKNPCSHLCLASPVNVYTCACPQGFNLKDDGKRCKADKNFPMLLVNDDSRIFYVRPQTVGNTSVVQLSNVNIDTIGRLAYDWESKSMYITDKRKPAILSLSIGTFIRKELVRNQMAMPQDIALDWINKNLYWVDSRKGTVEVVSTETSKTAVIIVDLPKPTAIALMPSKGQMFISTPGDQSLALYDMDGKNRKTLNGVKSYITGLAVHPTKSLLYFVSAVEGTLSSVDYSNSQSLPTILRSGIGNVLSVAVDKKYIYWTNSWNNVLSYANQNSSFTHIVSLPGPKTVYSPRKVIYASEPSRENLDHMSCKLNIECSYLCLPSPRGPSCICPSGMKLSRDDRTCVVQSSVEKIAHPCPGDEFLCENGKCILAEWRCDYRDDCGDNSDERDCTFSKVCKKNQFSCGDGQCIPLTLRCDGVNDCKDGTDEMNCNSAFCDPDTYIQCGNGQCVPNMWACDGEEHCLDGKDEKMCLAECNQTEFKCGDGLCIHMTLVCDEKEDCVDGSDEELCSRETNSITTEYICDSSTKCIAWSKLCNDHPNCKDGMNEEGGMCPKACAGECPHVCPKTSPGVTRSCSFESTLSQDGFSCVDKNECRSPGVCSQFCINSDDGFDCSCAEGYLLGWRGKCMAMNGPGILIYLSDGIKRIDLRTRKKHVFVSEGRMDMQGLDYDASRGIFFWSDFEEGTINIWRIQHRTRKVLITIIEKPKLLRWDWIQKILYFTDENENIRFCNSNGSYYGTVISNVGVPMNSFEISPIKGFMFWSVWRVNIVKESGKIERADLDGSNRKVIIKDGLVWPSSVTVDHVMEMIYWTDAKLNVMESADFYGFKRSIVISVGMRNPLSMATFEDFLYWSDWGTDSIMRCDKYTGSNCITLRRANVKARVLRIGHKVAQPKGNNRCLNNECPQLCLPTRSSYVCRCDDRYNLVNGTCELKTPTKKEL